MITINGSEYRKLQIENFNLKCEVQKLNNENDLLKKHRLSQNVEKLHDEKEKQYFMKIATLTEEIQRQRVVSVDVCRRHDIVQDELNKRNTEFLELTKENEQMKLKIESGSSKSQCEECRVQKEKIRKKQSDLDEVSGELEAAIDAIIIKENEVKELQAVNKNQKRIWKEHQKKIDELEDKLKNDANLLEGQLEYMQELECKIENITENNKNDKRKLEAIVAEREEKIKALEDKHANQQILIDKHTDENKTSPETSLLLAKQEESLKEATDIMVKLNEVIVANKKVLLKTEDEKTALQRKISNLLEERGVTLQFVEEVKLVSQFKEETDKDSLVNQLNLLGAHVRNKFSVLQKFCTLMEKTLQGGIHLSSSIVNPMISPITPTSTKPSLQPSLPLIKVEPLSIPPDPPISMKQDLEMKCLREVSKSIFKRKHKVKFVPAAKHLSIGKKEIEDCDNNDDNPFHQSAALSLTSPIAISTITIPHSSLSNDVDMNSDIEMIDLTSSPGPCISTEENGKL